MQYNHNESRDKIQEEDDSLVEDLNNMEKVENEIELLIETIDKLVEKGWFGFENF